MAGGVRPRPDADAARRARRSEPRLSGDPRRRHERQVDRDAHDRGAPAAPRACRVGATCRRTCAAGPSASRVDGGPADFERCARARPAARPRRRRRRSSRRSARPRFAEFAARGVDVAVVEAGLGGRLDATNVLRSHVVLLTNVGLEHTDVLGETREEIARREARRRAGRHGRRAAGRGVRTSRRAESSCRRRARGGGGVPRPAGRARGRGRAARPARAARRRDLGRRAQRRRRRLARRAARPRRLHRRRLDPARQGRRRDAALDARDERADARRDRVVERRGPFPPTSSRGCGEPTSRRSRSSPIPSRRSRAARERGPVLVTGSLYLLADLASATRNGA